MRVLSLWVKNFRGVHERAVELRPTGITVIVGPNEAGKSSMMDALDVLLEYQDSSKHRDVLATRPVGRDEATEIRAKLEAGPYRFTYWKRFHRQPATQLTLERPRLEQLEGKSAHDRVLEILAEHADLNLWRAVRIQQRQAKSPELAQSSSLRHALDAAAGGTPADTDETLYRRVEQEYLLYYTPTGRVKAAVADVETRVEAARARLRDADRQLAQAEADADRLERVERELRRAAASEASARRDLRDVAALLDLVEAKEKEQLTKIRQQMGAAAKRDRAAKAAAERRALVEQLDKARPRLEAARVKAADAAKVYEAQRAQAAGAAERREQAERALQAAREAVVLAEATEEVVAATAELAQLSARIEVVANLSDQLANRRVRRDAITLDDADYEQIRERARQADAAAAQLALGAPKLRLRALAGAVTLTGGGDPETLSDGAEVQLTVEDTVSLVADERLAITVSPGSSVAELRDRRRRAQADLDALLARHGLSSPADAERAIRNREALDSELTSLAAELQRVLEDEAPASLEARRRTLLSRRDALMASTPLAASMDAEAARRALEEAQQRFQHASEERDQWRERAAAETSRTDVVRHDLDVAQAAAVEAEQEVAQLDRLLSDARQVQSDEALAAEEARTTAELRDIEHEVQRLGEELVQLDPDAVRVRAENLRDLVDREVEQRATLSADRAECTARIEYAAQQQWFEVRSAAEAAAAAAAAELDGVKRRARAAEVLWRALRAAREREELAYRQPLADAIAQLGRIVYGVGFDVEVDEHLAVTHRTLDGIRLAVDQLSAGAREQMELLERLAAAGLVAQGDGVPVILDDTLGFTDEDRLQLMAAVLNRMARQCQIVILTSSPRRYERIGSAVRLDVSALDSVDPGAVQSSAS